jgi:hypothetical protein
MLERRLANGQARDEAISGITEQVRDLLSN